MKEEKGTHHTGGRENYQEDLKYQLVTSNFKIDHSLKCMQEDISTGVRAQLAQTYQAEVRICSVCVSVFSFTVL